MNAIINNPSKYSSDLRCSKKAIGLISLQTIAVVLILVTTTDVRAQRQGLVSTFGDSAKITNGFSFSQDARKLYISERISVGKDGGRHTWKMYQFGKSRRLASTLYEYDIVDGKLRNKRKVSFANDTLDYYPRLNHDGNRMFFVSRRPVPSLNAPDSTFSHVWMVEKMGNHWGVPQYVEKLNFIGYYSCYAHQLNDGSVVFQSNKPGSKPGPNGNPSLDLWISEWKNGAFQEPVNFEVFNSPHDEEQPYLDPTGKVFIFKRIFNDESHVYLSIKENGKWRKEREIYLSDMGGYDEHCPFLSHDGRTFFFSHNLTMMNIPFKELLTKEEIALLEKR